MYHKIDKEITVSPTVFKITAFALQFQLYLFYTVSILLLLSLVISPMLYSKKEI